MNIEEAVQKHAEWKLTFRNAMSRHEQMDVATISKDNCCAVGQWLYSEGQTRWGGETAFVHALSNHKAFHAEAGKVAALINAAQYVEAEAALAAGTSYDRASHDVETALMALKRAAGL